MRTVIDFEKMVREEVTIEVHIIHVKRVKLRLWIASRMIRLAVWIAGTQLRWNEEIGVIVKDKVPELEKNVIQR